MSAAGAPGPLHGRSVVEVAVGCSELGLGLAGGVPGMILADLGAAVTRVVGAAPAIDEGVPWGRAWHRDKTVVHHDDPAPVAGLLARADVALVYGAEDLVEGRGLGFVEMARANPALVYARCRPSRTGRGTVGDYGLLVEAAAGFCTQLAGHRPGPIFVDVRATGSGAALVLTASTLALLRRRELTGAGGWAETSLYDGMLSTLGCMIGRSERAAPEVEGYWAKGSTFPNFLYRCADGELIQVWFGGKGMYESVISVLGDEPSDAGYYADQVSGQLNARALRWRTLFAHKPREAWVRELRAAGVACEPVLAPGEVLHDPHAAEAGLVAVRDDRGHRDVCVATPIAVAPLAPPSADGARRRPAGAPGAPSSAGRSAGLLEGVRVVDFSAFVAGPLAAQVLADLGADVVKVEPPQGEAMRAAPYAVAACQRGKRSLALDIGAPEARPVVERLLGWADVVLHNFRVGVSERLGIDEDTVARLNPGAVYCHASGFGTSGPRARFPGNDALMQALTGFEQAVGGAGNEPIAGTWIPLDMCGGWVAAVGILAGMVGAARTGRGQRVATSLLGAGMLLQSGTFLRDGRCVRHPELDGAQTGYGPGYRLYQGGDGRWFALVVPDPAAWARLGSLPGVGGLPEHYAPLRGGEGDDVARRAEAVLEAAFAGAPAQEWVALLEGAGICVVAVEDVDRDGFRRQVLDDPVNRQLGRVVAYDTADWGGFEQIGPLLRCGPGAPLAPPLRIPSVGEDNRSVLADLGVPDAEARAIEAAAAGR